MLNQVLKDDINRILDKKELGNRGSTINLKEIIDEGTKLIKKHSINDEMQLLISKQNLRRKQNLLGFLGAIREIKDINVNFNFDDPHAHLIYEYQNSLKDRYDFNRVSMSIENLSLTGQFYSEDFNYYSELYDKLYNASIELESPIKNNKYTGLNDLSDNKKIGKELLYSIKQTNDELYVEFECENNINNNYYEFYKLLEEYYDELVKRIEIPTILLPQSFTVISKQRVIR